MLRPKAQMLSPPNSELLCYTMQEGSTALHFAVASRQNELLEGLLSAGCPVDARDNAENTPLHVAAGMLSSAGTTYGCFAVVGYGREFAQSPCDACTVTVTRVWLSLLLYPRSLDCP